MSFQLPGLRGDDPLGFLASVGLLSLSEMGRLPALRVSWGRHGALVAVLDGEVSSVEELGQQLRITFLELRKGSGVIPGAPPDLPRKVKGTKDPMRMSREEMRELYQGIDAAWMDGQKWAARWLIALAAQTATKDTQRGDVQLTPFYAPTGRMAMRTSIFEKTMAAVERVGGPTDALTAWRRISYDGANFDERAKRDAGVTTSGQADNQGAPSPTWLAAMGMRLFPMTDDGRRTETVGWQRVRLYPRPYTTRSLIWPIWEPRLDPIAVSALLAHPALRLHRSGDRVAPIRPRDLKALGVTHVFGASRRTLDQGDGPLGPTCLIWSASETRGSS